MRSVGDLGAVTVNRNRIENNTAPRRRRLYLRHHRHPHQQQHHGQYGHSSAAAAPVSPPPPPPSPTTTSRAIRPTVTAAALISSPTPSPSPTTTSRAIRSRRLSAAAALYVYSLNGTATLTNNSITGNTAGYGGGAYIFAHTATLTNNTSRAIRPNTAAAPISTGQHRHPHQQHPRGQYGERGWWTPSFGRVYRNHRFGQALQQPLLGQCRHR